MSPPRSRAAPAEQRRQSDRNQQQQRQRQAAPQDRRLRDVPDRPERRPAASPDQRQRAAPDRRERRPAVSPDRRQRVAPDQRQRAAPDRDRARPAPPRRTYDRRPEREWHRDTRRPRPPVYIPRRWSYRDRPYHRKLWTHHYSRVWWCGIECRIGLLFGFTVWAADTVVSQNSAYSFPVWEALEYSPTGETTLWESGWGYVEFTPTRTYKRRFGRYLRDCRDFLRVVVRNDGLERRYHGTACRNPDGAWWIVSSW